ncbi:hypothetical protein [Vandammella animalimorsus]|uniref:hypothetical protein n=1 Tax=Vandammella animalimorsus TaxID=2029117 RepID=UPI00117F2FFF|nr:hypothetical protein [Vandammella animalimorsus]
MPNYSAAGDERAHYFIATARCNGRPAIFRDIPDSSAPESLPGQVIVVGNKKTPLLLQGRSSNHPLGPELLRPAN